MPQMSIQEVWSKLQSDGMATPDAAVILGSGLGGFEHRLENGVFLPYYEVPGFPEVTVVGHTGLIGCGAFAGKQLLVFSGRFHFYEGHELSTTVLPVRLAAAAGAKHLIVTNAAGGINETYGVGDFMNIQDTLRIMRSGTDQPLHWGRLRSALGHTKLVERAASDEGLSVHNGTYLYVSGPNYETPAEIRMFRRMGADAVGMSTVPEIIEASRLGLTCAGISLITNAASGVTDAILDHADIQDVAEASAPRFTRLMRALVGML